MTEAKERTILNYKNTMEEIALTTYTVDLARPRTPTELHQQLREVFSLPETYGMNMDALWDCLSCAFREPVLIEVLHHDQAAPELSRSAAILKRLLLDLEEEDRNVSVRYPGS